MSFRVALILPLTDVELENAVICISPPNIVTHFPTSAARNAAAPAVRFVVSPISFLLSSTSIVVWGDSFSRQFVEMMAAVLGNASKISAVTTVALVNPTIIARDAPLRINRPTSAARNGVPVDAVNVTPVPVVAPGVSVPPPKTAPVGSSCIVAGGSNFTSTQLKEFGPVRTSFCGGYLG